MGCEWMRSFPENFENWNEQKRCRMDRRLEFMNDEILDNNNSILEKNLQSKSKTMGEVTETSSATYSNIVGQIEKSSKATAIMIIEAILWD